MRRASRALCSASIWASFLLSSVPARSEENARPTRGVSSLAAPATEANAEPKEPAKGESADVAHDAENAAQAAYERALSTYATGDVKGAYEQMRESYRLSQRPELLYNLARLEHELQECQASLEDYRRYLSRVPRGRYREAAEQASRELEQECPAADAAPQPAPHARQPEPAAKPPPPPVEPPKPAPPARTPGYWTTPHALGWSAVAAGFLAGGGALYFTLEAKSARDADQQSINAAAPGMAHHDPVLQNRQHRDQTWAQVLGITGGALIAGGALVLFLDARDRDHANARIFVAPGRIDACYLLSF